MADQSFTDLIPEVSPEVPGCPAPVIMQALRRAAIEACEKTLLWRYAQPKRLLLPGVHEYDYEKPANADVQVVFLATVNNAPLDVMTLDQALHRYPEWADVYSGQSADTLWSLTPSYPTGTQEFNEDTFNPAAPVALPEAVLSDAAEPRSITQLTPDKFVVIPLPDNMQEYSLRMVYALKPKRTATSMPAEVLNELTDVITHLALQRLLIVPNTSWTDQNLSNYHARRAVVGITERRARANLTNMRGSMTVSAPPFA